MQKGKKRKEQKQQQQSPVRIVDVMAKGVPEFPVPYHVSRVFSTETEPRVFGDQVTFGEDFVSLQEARVALEWYVEQLGGKVEWDATEV